MTSRPLNGTALESELADDMVIDQDKGELDTKHVEDSNRLQMIEGVDVVVPVSHFASMSRAQVFRTFWRVGLSADLVFNGELIIAVHDVLFHGFFRCWHGRISTITSR